MRKFWKKQIYTGDFDRVKNISKNPQGSLGWSGSFIEDGIRLFLLYLYERPIPSKSAKSIASYIGFPDEKDQKNLLKFEIEIRNECQEHKVSEFWNYFQRWKGYFPMEKTEREKYLTWAENIVYKRADAIVAEIKEDTGMPRAKKCIFDQYKKKFPRHSSFQREMKYYFNIAK